ncbi:hypothetical protein BpHYR1_047166 [Brachionus plicatilis]|uniref:Uncharacterized protein n=1 Tax=Brachionus plicatilis TaxID=10195 RepID=A0A3M7S1Q8_BRAPC|nr:hypothetical protein BpHYR1_047166 [Brachionus plicatilis]
MLENYINQINNIISDHSMKSSCDEREFFGYILISQIETVESVHQLEKKYDLVSIKSGNLEKMVEFLTEKCVLLEKDVYQLKKLVYDHSQPVVALSEQSNVSEKNVKLAKNELECKLVDKVDIATQSGCSSCKKESLDSKTVINCEEIKSEDSCSGHTIEHDNREIQRLFNKRVKYEVNKKFGPKYLAEHQVRELDVKEMYRIKKKVVKLFSPFPLPIKAAWNNAMNSLRQDRHQLKKKIH